MAEPQKGAAVEELSPLFRQEAIEARRVRLDGEILLVQPFRSHAAATLLFAAVAFMGIWIALGSYARTESAKGMLVTDSGTTKMMGLRPGVITGLAVVEGQHVRKGQPLATVQVDQDYAAGSRTTAESLKSVAEQRVQADRQEASAGERGRSERAGLIASIASDRGQRADVEAQIAIQQQLVSSLRDTLTRYGPVAARGFISQTEMDRRRQELLTAQGELIKLHQESKTLIEGDRKAQAQLEQSRADEANQSAIARSSAAGFRRQQAELRGEQSYVLLAPEDGVVTAVQTGLGRAVDPAVPLMTIIPSNAAFHAELFAPSRAIGFIKPGDEVRLRYDAFPYERFGSFKGHVTLIAKIALDPRQVDAPFKFEEPVYRIDASLDQQKVTGYGSVVPLQAGMTLSASLILERRSFFSWLLEPLNAVANREQ